MVIRPSCGTMLAAGMHDDSNAQMNVICLATGESSGRVGGTSVKKNGLARKKA